jgi:hypothetical protein
MSIPLWPLAFSPTSVTFLPRYVKDTLKGNSNTLGFLVAVIRLKVLVSAIYLAFRKEIRDLEKVVVMTILLSNACFIPLFYINIVPLTIKLSIVAEFKTISP